MKNKYLVYEPFTPMAEEILKYLIPFRKLKKYGVPVFSEDDKTTSKDWNNYLDKMIFSFKAIVKDNPKYNFKNNNKIEEGLQLFAKYFRSLWD